MRGWRPGQESSKIRLRILDPPPFPGPLSEYISYGANHHHHGGGGFGVPKARPPLAVTTRSRAGLPPSEEGRSTAAQSVPEPPSEEGREREDTGSMRQSARAVTTRAGQPAPEEGREREDAGSMRQSPPVGVTTRSRAGQLAPASLSEEGKRRESRMRGKKKRKGSSRASEDGNNSEKRVRASDKDREDEELATAVDKDLENEAAKTVDDEPAASSSYTASSAISSPSRCPCLPLVVIRRNSDGTDIYDSNIDPDVLEAYFEEEEKYCSKLERERNLLTLSQELPRTCLSSQNLLPVRESVTDMTLQAAKSVISLSSYIDGKPLAQCTGFFVDWNDERKIGKLLTSAHIICSRYPSIHDISDTREYITNAQVKVHLSHNINVDGRLLFYHEYYHIAVFEVSLEQPPKLLCLHDDVKYAEEVFLLGRNERFYLNIDHSRVQFMGPGIYEPNHYMYVSCRVSKCSAGGPVVNFDGKVVGMADPTLRPAFIPISVLVRCLHMQKEFKCIPRLCLGLKFSSIKFLEASHIEQIIGRFNIDKGLIVKQVSEGSVAEKVGIRTGDIIECLNGEHVSTTVDLENLLLRICEDHFNKGNGLGSKVDITFDIFSIRKERHLTKKLTANVSDGAEVIKTGTYLVSARKGLSTSSDLSRGREAPHGMVESGLETPY